MTKMVKPTDGMVIREDVRFEPGVYHLPAGVSVQEPGITVGGNGALLIGGDRQGTGVGKSASGVTVCGLRLRDYYHGIRAEGISGIRLAENQITSTAEVPANTIFLDIWLDAANSYGGAILLSNCEEAHVQNNDLQHQQSGLLTYNCRKLS